LEFATPREAWGGEATSFTPLLAREEMLDYLGRETGIGPLAVSEVEHRTAGNRSLDILAETLDGRRVAIENQYGVANHDHLTRGLAYAVATESKALVLVAEDHRDEFVSVANYLNDVGGLAGDTGVLVWLVKVRAVRREGDSVWSPEFVVQVEPNEWEAAIRRTSAAKLASLDEFYSKAEAETGPGWADSARTIIEGWLSRGFSEGHDAKKSVGLYCPSPRYPDRGTNVLQVLTTGDLVVCRGYIWETSGVFDPDQEPSDLDEQIHIHFPDANWPPKRYFITARKPDPDQVQAFADWLVQRFQQALKP